MDVDEFQDFQIFDTEIMDKSLNINHESPNIYHVHYTPTTSPSTPDGFTYGLRLSLGTDINNNIFNFINPTNTSVPSKVIATLNQGKKKNNINSNKSTTNTTNTSIESNASTDRKKGNNPDNSMKSIKIKRSTKSTTTSIESKSSINIDNATNQSKKLFSVTDKSNPDPSLLFFIKTLIEIRNNAILIQDNMTLNQFERFEEVLSKFKKLMVLQSNEKITRAKVSQRGKKYPPLETKAINYVLKFLEEENIDMTNLFHTTALYQRCNPIESIETKKRKFIVSEPSTLNTSTSIETNMSTPSTKVMSIRSVGPPVHGCGARANVSLIISEATGPTNISLPTIMAEDSNIIKNYKHEFNNTPVKATSLMYQLDYSNTVNNFLNIQKIAIETIDGADMFLSMQIY